MAKPKQEYPLPEIPAETTVVDEVPTEVHDSALTSLFNRGLNNARPVKTLTLKRTLTKPLISMAHLEELVFTCQTDVYVMELPASGARGEGGPVRVIDGTDVASAEECILIVSEMMSSAFMRGGFRTYKPKMDKGVLVGWEELAGASLNGHSFAFRSGDIKDGGRYRVVQTAEVEITY